MNKAEWNRAIKAGKILVKRENNLQWAWGDLVVKAVKAYDEGYHGDIGAAIALFISDVGWDGSASTMWAYYSTAKAWPKNKRVKDCSYRAHVYLNNNEDRFSLLKPGMRANEAAEIAGKERHDKAKRLYEVGGYEYQDALELLSWAIRLERKALQIVETLPVEEYDPIRKQYIRNKCDSIIEFAKRINDSHRQRNRRRAA